MPIYEFECDVCGFVIEKFFRIIPRIDTTHLKDDCPNCMRLDTSFKKVLSLTSFKLEGMGWAIDGYDKNAPYRVREIDEPSVI